jgi:c-di-GMP phosphodiesterase
LVTFGIVLQLSIKARGTLGTFRRISYKKLVFVIVMSITLIGVGIGAIFKISLVDNSTSEISETTAKILSKLAFESLNVGVENGWKKDDIDRLIHRINTTSPGFVIDIVRNDKVAKMFGDSEAGIRAKKDANMYKALDTGDEQIIRNTANSTVRYIYPIMTKAECLSCHTNLQEGYVAGAVDIVSDTALLRASIGNKFNQVIWAFLGFLLFVFAALYLAFRVFLVLPMKNLSESIKTVMRSGAFETRVSTSSRVTEIRRLQSYFNRMLAFIEEFTKRQKEQMTIDALTGLPNRFKLKEDLSTMAHPVVILLNIDSFKEINDLYSVKVGDFVLQEFANTTNSFFTANETLYRFAGDEYCILIDSSELSDADIDSYAHNILGMIKKSLFIYNDYEIMIDVTAGASTGAGNILERADIALKVAKKSKKDFLMYSDKLQITQQYEYNMKWTKILKNAIEANRIVTYYQPIINNKTREIEKFEALIRLVEEDGKIVSPYFFLEVAKKTKIYPQLTKIVIKNAFRAFAYTNYQFSINISVEDAMNYEIRELIYEKLSSFPKPQNVIFEITEGEGIENFVEINEFIGKVKEFGCQIAIDDFGTGYSNFAYILKLSVDIVKLDATLVKNVDTDKNSEIIISTIVSFCKQMNIKTVAEFVHSESIYNKTCELGIDYSQGFYFSEPKAHI